MTAEQIKQLIEQGLEGAKVSVTGSEGKFEATVICKKFLNITTIEQHKMVYATVDQKISSGEIHALSLKTTAEEN